MRFGKKLVALSALAALIAPASGDASEYHHLSAYVREARVASEASVLKDGQLKKGVMTLVFRFSQGVQYDQPQQAGNLGVFNAVPFLGLGAQTQTTGLPRAEACLSVIIPGVLNFVNRCTIYGVPYFNSDPVMNEVELGASFGTTNEPRQAISLSLEGTGDLSPEPESDAAVTPQTATPRTIGVDVDINQMFHRPGIVVSGQITDPRFPLIYVKSAGSVVTLRTGLVHDSSFTRGPVFCTAGLHFPIGYPAGGGLPVIGPYLHPDINGDGKPDYVDDYTPPGCYPDDPLDL